MHPPEPDHRRAAWRVRWAMYLAFAVLAVLALLQAGQAHRFERMRGVDAELGRLAAAQHAFVQQVGRLSALAGGEAELAPAHAQSLREAFDRARTDALILDAMAGSQLVGEADDAALQRAAADWTRARDALWRPTQQLLQQLESGHLDHLGPGNDQVQRAADLAFEAATRLGDALRVAADRRSAVQLRWLEGGAVLTLLLLGLLAFFVVEPTARSVQSQLGTLAEQAAELERLALVAERTDNVVVLIGRDRRVQWANQAFLRRNGRTLGELVGRSAGSLLATRLNEPQLVRRVRRALIRGEGVRAELLSPAGEGREYWVDVDVRPLHGPGGALRGFVAVGSDVSERRRLQEQLRHSARTDALTGLPNRAVVLERIQRAIGHAQLHPGYGFAVLFMDLDRFKQVNDTLGHAMGDELLCQMARRIERTLRPGDAVARVESQLHVAARMGGDEFVVVLEGIRSTEDARTVAQRLLDVLAEPFVLGGHTVHGGASIGIVGSDRGPGSADDVLRDADTAMYEAKRAGRGRCVVFDASMHERVMQALEVENDLRRALRDKELFVVYQPVIDLDSGAMVAAEALVRWRHPTQGVVPPVRFIGVAEETGLIDAIGQEVLAEACRQLAAWRASLGERAPSQIAVNLSRAQLQQPGLVPEVRHLLDLNGLEPGALELEITESLAAQDERVQATLRELKALGVRLALDDFGTGYSSLACLHLLPVDTVKIDRSFVMHAETVEYHRVLIEATIRVAQTLGMTTVAEGIETEGQAELMERLRCHRGQGWLWARPMPAEDLERWLMADRDAVVISD